MKILHLAGEREDVGGVLTVIRNLQSASREWSWHHTVCVHTEYVEIRRPPLRYWHSAHVCSDSPSHVTLFLQGLRTLAEVKKLLRSEAFDVLHAHSRGTFLVGLALALGSGRPVLFTNHAYSRRVQMYRWAAQQRNYYTVLLTPNMAKHYGIVANPPKVSIISECCADRLFQEPLIENAAQTRRDRPIRLAGIGNIMRWKNWGLLFKALALLNPDERQRLTFSLWGPVPCDEDSQVYAGELRQMVRELRLEKVIEFRGMSLTIIDCLRDADWFVLPSTNEPCSVALIEALALGLPALVSASGGNVDILQPGKTGLLFQPDDALDLAAKLRQILNSEWVLLPPSQIRDSVRHRSGSEVAKQYRAIYEELQRKRRLEQASLGRKK